ncbi:hypothetical protein AVEN_137549-1 [Araneus ventricosus]|uniref:Uncharacterized protein n=1 Tax=Araneus ventricosus TaxID=182803 RepID=A0A4Y2FL83_ARAVE|nr:hypothetical protein AVEN_137549-1 [Araneus ventricosus]
MLSLNTKLGELWLEKFKFSDSTVFLSSLTVSSHENEGSGDLVVRSRLRGRRVPASKPNSSKDLPCMGPAASWSNGIPLVRCGSLERGCQFRRYPHHLTAV